MESTITVTLDAQLKADAERTLEELGLTMASAVRVFLTQVVTRKEVPFPIQAELTVDMNTPPEITAEIVIELIASVCADLRRLAAAAPSAAACAEIDRVYDTVRSLRMSFNPHDRHEVEAVLRKVGGYADALRSGASH